MLRALEQTLESLAPDEAFRRKHPPSPYDQRYNQFGALDTLYRYWKNDGQQGLIKTTQMTKGFYANEPVQPKKTVIELHKLVAFLTNPIRYYYNNNLGIYLDKRIKPIQDSEHIHLDQLEQWIFKNNCLRAKLRLQHDDMMEHFVAAKLPLKNIGKVTRLVLEEMVKPFFEHVEDLRNITPRQQYVEYPVSDNITLVGTIEGIYNQTLVKYSISSSAEKHFKLQLQTCIEFRMLGEHVNNLRCWFLRNPSNIDNGERWLKDTDWIKDICAFYVERRTRLVPVVNFGILGRNLPKNQEELDKKLQMKLLGDYATGLEYETHAYQNGLFNAPDSLSAMREWHNKVFNCFRKQ